MILALSVLAATIFCTLLYAGRGYLAWLSGVVLVLAAWWLATDGVSAVFGVVAAVAFALALIFGVAAVRRVLISRPLMRRLAPLLPARWASRKPTNASPDTIRAAMLKGIRCPSPRIEATLVSP